MVEKKEVKKIGLGLVISWIVSILFLLVAIGFFVEKNYIAGILSLLIVFISCPYTNSILREKLSIELSRNLKIAIVLILFLVVIAITSTTYTSETTLITKQETRSGVTTTLTTVKPQLVKSAKLEIKTVNGNWYGFGAGGTINEIGYSIKNTGDVTIYPTFDLYIYDESGKEIYSDIDADTFSWYSSLKSQKEEIKTITTWIDVKEKGTYTVKLDLRDGTNPEILSSSSKEITLG